MKHKHRCNCGVVWDHDDGLWAAPARIRLKAHQCPKCQRKMVDIYHGPLPAEYHDHHKETPCREQ